MEAVGAEGNDTGPEGNTKLDKSTELIPLVITFDADTGTDKEIVGADGTVTRLDGNTMLGRTSTELILLGTFTEDTMNRDAAAPTTSRSDSLQNNK